MPNQFPNSQAPHIKFFLQLLSLAALTFGMFALVISATASAPLSENPDLPAWLTGSEEADYLRLREEQVALYRGWEPGKPFDASLRVRALAQMERQIQRRRREAPEINSVSWTPIGPNPIPNGQTQSVSTAVSGRTISIAIHPTNPDLVYVGTAQGGLYRTANGGTTWTQLFDTAASLAIGALALAPSDPTILYVGTGEPSASCDSFAGVGLYRVDNANTSAALVGPINPVRNYLDVISNPQSVPIFNGRSIDQIVVHPTQPGTIFVGTAGGNIGVGCEAALGGNIPPLGIRGLYRSFNANAALGSIAFEKIGVSTAPQCFDTPCTGNRNINDMIMDPDDATGNTLIVYQFGGATDGDGGVWRSTNALDPTATNVTFTQTFQTTDNVNGRGILASYNPAGSLVIYAATGESAAGTSCGSASTSIRGALRQSTDGGVTWSGILAGGGGFCGAQCFYNLGLAVVPGATTATDRVHLGGQTSSASCQRIHAKSTDGGATFTNFDSGLHADTHAIAVAPSNSAIIYLGGDGGIYKSMDTGDNWTSLNNTGFNATQFQSIAVHPTNFHFSIGGTQDNGTNLYTSAGWNRIDFGDGGFALIDQNAPDTTNVRMYHTYFNRTNAMGFATVPNTTLAADNLWTFYGCGFGGAIANGMTCAATAILFYAPMALGPGNPSTLYFGSDVLYRSDDLGATMTKVSQEPIVIGAAITAIGIAPQNDNVRVVGLRNGDLFFTTTGASLLTNLDPTHAILNRYVTRAVIDPSNQNTVYVTLAGYMDGSTTTANSHIWRVTNLSAAPAITSINGGGGANPLPDVPINGLVVDTNDPSQPGVSVLYAGTDIGVYRSVDNGANWTPFGTGLPRVAVFDMALQPTFRALRIATHGRGMWEISLPGAPTATTLVSFHAKLTRNHKVQVKWTTGNEINVLGFNVHRATKKDGAYKKLNAELIAAKNVGSVAGAKYSFRDKTVKPAKTYFYKVEIVKSDGTSEWSEVVRVKVE